jgi:hypothetical protein
VVADDDDRVERVRLRAQRAPFGGRKRSHAAILPRSQGPGPDPGR